MWEFILPTLISTIGGAVTSGTQAYQAERQNQMAASTAQQRRAQLNELIAQIRDTDYRGLERGASAQFSQAADQIEALTAGRGTFGSGATGARNLQTQALSDILTQLGMQKNQDELARQQMIGNIMGDQAFMVPDPALFNPGQAGMTGTLMGGAGGLASGAAAFFATDGGQEWLKSLGGSAPAAPAPSGPTGNFGVQIAPIPGVAPQATPVASWQQPYVPAIVPRVAGPMASQAALPPGGYNPGAWGAPVQTYVTPLRPSVWR